MSEYNFQTITTLCYILNDQNEVLLIMKKRGVGEGKWNGPGGKVDQGETIEEAIIREVKEETGLTISSLENKGILEFVAPETPEIESRCHLFITRDFTGEAVETEECYSRWHNLDELPFEKMWDDDIIWLGKLLTDFQEIRYRFFFDANEKIKKYEEF